MNTISTLGLMVAAYALLLTAAFAFFRAGQIWQRRTEQRRRRHPRGNAKPTVIVQNRDPVTGQFVGKSGRNG